MRDGNFVDPEKALISRGTRGYTAPANAEAVIRQCPAQGMTVPRTGENGRGVV